MISWLPCAPGCCKVPLETVQCLSSVWLAFWALQIPRKCHQPLSMYSLVSSLNKRTDFPDAVPMTKSCCPAVFLVFLFIFSIPFYFLSCIRVTLVLLGIPVEFQSDERIRSIQNRFPFFSLFKNSDLLIPQLVFFLEHQLYCHLN